MAKKESYLAGRAFIDLFAGVGGFHLGMESIGMKCVFASEWDEKAAAVYERNFKLKPHGDITKISADDVPDHTVVCGGFPCQAFSISGKKLGFADTRGTLFFDVARIAEKKRPEVLFLENVQNFARHDGGKTLKTVVGVLESMGYTVFHQVLNSAEYGFPTARKRIYIVAFRSDLGVVPKTGFVFPSEVGKAAPLKGFLDKKADASALKIAKKALIDPERAGKAAVRAFARRHPCAPVRIGTIGAGGQGDRVYSIEGPAITLSAYGGGNAAKTGAYLVDGVVRKLSPRECANVMGFPKRYKISENKNQAYKQFGNSVVVGVISLIAVEIDKTLSGLPKKKAPRDGA